MGGEYTWRTTIALVPPMVPPLNQKAEKEDDQQWSSNFDNSVNAVYMGFVATAILISMFIVIAIFERFFRRSRTASQLSDTARTHFSYDSNRKLDHNSSKVSFIFELKLGLQITFPSFFRSLFDYLKLLKPFLRESHRSIDNPKAGNIIHQSSNQNRYRKPHGIIF